MAADWRCARAGDARRARGGQAHHRHLRAQRAVRVGRRALHLHQPAGAADHVGGGRAAEGKAFARAADFETAIKNKQVDFAVIDGVYLAERGVPYAVLATATTGGDTAPRWALFSSAAAHVVELQGKKLSIAATGGGPRVLVERAVRRRAAGGQILRGAAKAPDIAVGGRGGVAEQGGRVFAPEARQGAAQDVRRAAACPTRRSAWWASRWRRDLVSKVKARSSATARPAGARRLEGASAEPYRALAGRMARKTRRPVMAEPEACARGSDVLVPTALEPGLPELKGSFWSRSRNSDAMADSLKLASRSAGRSSARRRPAARGAGRRD